MKTSANMIPVRVAALEQVTPHIRHFTLEALDGRALPAFTGGSHILVKMQSHTNAYSLLSDPDDTRQYQIAVRREEHSRGGSVFMHEQVGIGSELLISSPNNLFPLQPQARQHLLIAGGIGITPFLSQLHELRRRGDSYELHYAFQGPEHGAFREMLEQGPHAPYCHFYAGSTGERMDLEALLGQAEATTHVYVCGPQRLIDTLKAAAQRLGIEPSRVHWEQFGAAQASTGAFTLVLGRSGRELHIEEGVSILEAIERTNAAQVECMCREGVCGTCETRILEGEAEHLDQFLTPEEKAAQQSLMICVSRSRSARLVLDL